MKKTLVVTALTTAFISALVSIPALANQAQSAMRVIPQELQQASIGSDAFFTGSVQVVMLATPPGVKHWHGASAQSGMTHTAIQEVKDGKNVEWMEQLTDQEYLNNSRGSNITKDEVKKMNLIIGSKTYKATLNDNETATKLKTMFPLVMEMRDLHNNEKYFDFSVALPTESENPGIIYKGDIMLWQNNTLVLFYETFKTPYAYTRIGKLDNPAELAETLGSGNVMVTLK